MADTEDPGYVWPTPRAFKFLQRAELSRWFDAGVAKKASHMLVLEDQGRVEPLYVYPAEEGMKVGGVSAVALGDPDHSLYSRWRARKVLEVYHLGMDKEPQLETHNKQRSFNLYIPEGIARPTLHPEAFKTAATTPAQHPQMEQLAELCGIFRYELVLDPHPHLRSDALGATDLPGSGDVQLCKDKVIAVAHNPDSASLVYSVSHELAHGIVGFCDEKDVLYEQTNILARWVRELLRKT